MRVFTACIRAFWSVSLRVRAFATSAFGSALDDEAVDDDALSLALPVESGFALRVKLEAPGQAVPDEVMPALLEVQPVGAAGRLGQQNVQLSRVPLRLRRAHCPARRI